jgi:hypothetical protein
MYIKEWEGTQKGEEYWLCDAKLYEGEKRAKRGGMNRRASTLMSASHEAAD